MDSQVKVIAYYLPQYHPIPENDEWWGKGFTEWTNVGKAKPLFPGHYQPKVPADLGYYDLRVEQTRLQQAELAREYGIDGFCYYHYWFGKGRRLLETPFNEVLKSKNPDFPFMLCWANDDWKSKMWSTEGVSTKKVLMENIYGDEEEYTEHFFALLEAFKDTRYITIQGMPAFGIYDPLKFEKVSNFIKVWQKLAKENGLKGIYFIGQTGFPLKDTDNFLSLGFNAVNSLHIWDIRYRRNSLAKRAFYKAKSKFLSLPIIFDYEKAMKLFSPASDEKENVYPTILPNWDHTPRSGTGGTVFINSSPKNFEKHLTDVLLKVRSKSPENQVCFLKSWNEWGEGNYVEPDLKYGKQYLEVIKKVREKLKV